MYNLLTTKAFAKVPGESQLISTRISQYRQHNEYSKYDSFGQVPEMRLLVYLTLN